ncbi:MAG: DUF1648 domain-containing protein [Lachnospiraceae bacterium]|nr:DUF1648 domain-containing protein [Lachnospiraceae bacterium]
MIKQNKKRLILTSIIVILPIIIGLILWGKLPDQIATHWNAAGEADRFSSKSFAILGMPLFVLAIHWICFIITTADPKNKNIEGKTLGLVLWICPVMSLLCGTVIYSTALGFELSVEVIMPLVMGVMFIIIGNYLPKCKQNYSIGIKVPWALNSEENWRRTHRFGGRLWVLGGVIIIATAFLRWWLIFFVVVLVMGIVPTVYSYLYYKKYEKK